MNPLKTLVIVAFLFCSITSCSQVNYGIKKVNGYTEIRQRGTLQVDDFGNPVNIEPIIIHTIYVEAPTNSKIEWNLAWWHGKAYAVAATLSSSLPMEVGIGKVSGQKIILKPENGNKLWKLELMPTNKKGNPPSKKSKGIILEGKINSKKIVRSIDQLTELSVPDAV